MEAWLLAGLLAVALSTVVAVSMLRPGWITASPRFVLLLLFLLTAAAAASLVETNPFGFRLKIDPSTEPLLPAGDPGQALYESAVLDFGDDEVYVIALECEEVFTPECLGIIDRISGPILRLEGVRSVTSLMDVTSFRYVAEEDWIEVAPFIKDIPSDLALLADLKTRALRNPVYQKTLISDDGRTTAINVNFRKMSNAELIDRDLDGKIQTILAQEAGSNHRFYVSGRPHFKTHVYRGMLSDLLLLIPLGIAIMATVLSVFMGSLRGVLLPIASSLMAILWTFAAMQLAGLSLNLLTVLLAPMLLASGSVYALHVVSRFDEEMSLLRAKAAAVDRTGYGEASLNCLRHMAMPVAIAGATTIIGFAALLLTDVPAVFELGVLAMLGIASVTLISLTGVPAALILLPVPGSTGTGSAWRRLSHSADAMLSKLLLSLAKAIRKRNSTIIFACLLASICAVAALPKIVIDTDYLSYFEETDPVRIDFDAINDLLAGAVPLYLILEGGTEGGFREPEVLRQIEVLQERLNALPGISRSLSFVDSLKMLNRSFEGDDPAEERVPDTRGSVTELLFMLPKTEMSRYITINHDRANVVLRTGFVGSSELAELTQQIEEVIAQTPFPNAIRARLTGNAILLGRSADGIAEGQPRSVLLAALCIFVLIAVGLRSPKLGAVAMLPNLLPVLLFFGLLGAGAAPLSLPTSLIGCIALGIAIDDTVHFLVRYRAERLAGADPNVAAERCGQRVGRPIAITSVMLVLGFLVVAFSRFATLQEFGVLTAVTMGLCLIADLILLPALLTRLRV